MDPNLIVRRFLAKGLFKVTEETLDEAAGLLKDLKAALREPGHTADEKKEALAGPLTQLSSKLHHVFARLRRFDLDFTPQESEKDRYEDLGAKLHRAEAAVQRLANFVLHPEKHLEGDESFHPHAEAAWSLAHEAFKEVHAAMIAAQQLQPPRQT